MNDRNKNDNRTESESQEPSNAPSAADPVQVTPPTPQASQPAPAVSESPSGASSDESGAHDYREIAPGVEARATTEAERQARNKLAAAQDEMNTARGGQ